MLLQEALKAMNIRTLTKENYEADDILATLAKAGADSDFNVFVVSGDRDTFQLISERTTILYPVKGVMNLARMDDAAVYEKYGVHAHQYPDLAALVGACIGFLWYNAYPAQVFMGDTGSMLIGTELIKLRTRP